MKKFIVLLLAVALLAGFSSVSFAVILNSPHDFSAEGFAAGQICVVCHAPHNVATPVIPPLWNHAVTTATYLPY